MAVAFFRVFVPVSDFLITPVPRGRQESNFPRLSNINLYIDLFSTCHQFHINFISDSVSNSGIWVRVFLHQGPNVKFLKKIHPKNTHQENHTKIICRVSGV